MVVLAALFGCLTAGGCGSEGGNTAQRRGRIAWQAESHRGPTAREIRLVYIGGGDIRDVRPSQASVSVRRDRIVVSLMGSAPRKAGVQAAVAVPRCVMVALPAAVGARRVIDGTRMAGSHSSDLEQLARALDIDRASCPRLSHPSS